MQKTDNIFINKVRKKIFKTIGDFDLITSNDKIVVGISGGKDSLVLVDTLAHFRTKTNINFELCGLFVDIKNIPYKSDINYLTDFCNKRNVSFDIVELEIDISNTKKSPCFFCSWNRRKALFKYAKEINAKKIALGHHLDDVLQTLFMNMTYHSNISTIPPILKMNKWECAIIRPLSMCPENELKKYSGINDFRVQETVCPYGNETERAKIKQIINEFDKLAHNAKINIFHSLSNIIHEYLPQTNN